MRHITTLAKLCLAGAVVGSCALLAAPAQAAGTTYYIDNREGSDCSNNGPGTSQDQPWCDFSPVNDSDFEADDSILLARGAEWNQELYLNEAGEAGAPITVDAYGEGTRPKIIRDGAPAQRGVVLRNPSHVRVANLEIGGAVVGVLNYFDSLDHQGLVLDNLYVHDISGVKWPGSQEQPDVGAFCDANYGMSASAAVSFTAPQMHFTSEDTMMKNIVLRDLDLADSEDGISFDFCNGQGGQGTDGNNLVRGVTIQDVHAVDIFDEALRLVNLRHATVMNTQIVRAGNQPVATGKAAVFLGRTRDVTVANSIVRDVPDTGSPDQTGIDYEVANDQVDVKNSLLTGNAGPGLELLALAGREWDHSEGHEISGNMFLNNAVARKEPYLGGINQHGNGGPDYTLVPTGTIRDNLHSEHTGFLTTAEGGSFDGFTVENNKEFGGADRAFYAGADFVDEPARGWSYESSSGDGDWAPLEWDANVDRYTDGENHVDKFWQSPAEGATVARSWTVPETSFVTIRSRAIPQSTANEEVTIRITRNGHTVWGPETVPAGGFDGVVANLDDLHVAADDVLRFEVDGVDGQAAGATATSWTPAITYTPADQPPPPDPTEDPDPTESPEPTDPPDDPDPTGPPEPTEPPESPEPTDTPDDPSESPKPTESPDGDEDGGGDGELPDTGAPVGLLVAGAAMTIGGGAATRLAARRS